MDKKTLTYITGFTAVIAIALALYVFSGLFLKKSTLPTPPPQFTPSFTFSPKEPESARVIPTPGATESAQTPVKVAQLKRIEITNAGFSPSSVEINKGDVITWTNKDSQPHKIIGKSWRSGVIQPEKAFSQQFDVIAVYQYYTEANPSLTGTIIVK